MPTDSTVAGIIEQASEIPDREHICIDDDGQCWFKFAVDFDHEGASYSIDIWATDFDDAEARVESLRGTARLDGQVYAEISYAPR